MPILSKFNNTYAPLGIDGFFLGALEVTEGSVSISCNVFADVATTVIIRQYRTSDPTTIVQEDSTDVPASTKQVVQFPCKAAFFNVAVLNQSGGSAALVTQCTTYLTSTHFVDLDVRQLSATTKEDSVLCFGVDGETGLAHVLNTDASGNLIVISSGGGGGDASLWSEFPALQIVDMNNNGLTNVNAIGGVATKGLPILADGILNLSSNSGVVLSSKVEIALAIPPEPSPTPLPTKTLTYDVSGNLTFEEGEQNISNLLGTTTSKGFTLTQGGGGTLDMNGNNILNANEISSVVDNSLSIIADVNLDISAKNNISLVTANDAATPNIIEYTELGNLVFYEGEQNITNLLGVTTSKEFTLTQGGGGVITFEDGTTMATAGGGGGGGNFSTPSDVTLDMSGNKIINITQLGGVGEHYNPIIVNNDIRFAGTAEFGSASQMTNLEYLYGNVDNGLTITNVATVSNGSLASDLLIVSPQVILSGNLKFNNDVTIQTTAYQNPFQTTLDLNGNSVIRTQQIFGNNDMTFTAGMTNTSEDSSITLSNNGYAIAGKYSQIYLTSDGVQLNTGDITAVTDYKAILDMDGVFTAPSLAVATGGGGSLRMNGNSIIDVNSISSSDNTSIAITTNQTGSIILRTNAGEITEKTAFLATTGEFTAPSFTLQSGGGGSITFANNSVQTVGYTGADVQTITSTDGSVVITTPSANTVNLSVPTPQGITSNTFFVNDNVNTINDVLPLMGNGDICIVSAGSFANTTDITWNKAQTGLSGSVAPLPLTFLTTANASRFTVSATQVRIANIKFQMPVFLSANNCTIDNCDFDDNLTIGTGVSGYITINNCEFVGTKTITVASSFTNVCYFINCNFLSSTFVLSQPASSQIIFNNCAGFTTYPANATYIGTNVSSAGSSQLSTNTMKSVVTGGTIKFLSNIDMDGNSTINCNNIGGRTGDPVTFTNGLELQTGGGAFNMRGNSLFTVGTMTQVLSGSTTVTTQGSATASRFLQTVTIPSFTGGANAVFQYNDLGTLSLKNVTLTTGGVVTYPDTTFQETAYKNLDVQTITNTDGMLTITAPTTHGRTIQSAMKKGTATLGANGAYDILDNTVTASCVCVATYADDSPTGGVLCAKVQAGYGITIQSTLLADRTSFFYMYFI